MMMFQPGRCFFGMLILVAFALHVWQRDRCPEHAFVAGVVYPPIFTLQEYLAHRFLLHEVPSRASRSHTGHHKYNVDLQRIFVPVPVTLLLAVTTAAAAWGIHPETMPSVVMSMILGYLLFEFSHYAAHVPQETRLLHRLRKHHLLHHSKSGTKYGFVSAAWDIAFHTYGESSFARSPWLYIPYPVLPFVAANAGLVEWVTVILAALPAFVHADEELYREYHRHPGNIAVHVLCVPMLVGSVLACMAHVPVANGVTMAHVASITYTLFRASDAIDVVTMAWMFAMACHVSHARYSARFLLGTHVASWCIQVIVGHQMLERARPALVDSLLPSLLVAPTAVTRDVLSYVLVK